MVPACPMGVTIQWKREKNNLGIEDSASCNHHCETEDRRRACQGEWVCGESAITEQLGLPSKKHIWKYFQMEEILVGGERHKVGEGNTLWSE